jgi:hypothetical protein
MTLETTNLSYIASDVDDPSPSISSSDDLPSKGKKAPNPPDEGLPIGEDTYFVEAPAGAEQLRSKDLYACLSLSKQLGQNVTVRRQSDGKLLAYKSAFSLTALDRETGEG